jgi:O-antigen/teichoic acid export membrane protein
MRGPGEARLLASGALLQQLAQGSGLLALLVIVTLLARRVSVPELAAYGLISSLAGYLLVLKNSVSNSSVRAMASAADNEERARVFSAAAVLYAIVGLGTGVMIALAAVILSATVFDGDLAVVAREGGLGLGAITAVGITASVYLDALRAERRFVRAASAEIVAVSIYVSILVALILSGAGLAVVIALTGALPLISGTLCAFLVRREDVRLRIRGAGATRAHTMAIVPTARWLLVVEACTVITYASGRIMLGAFRSPRAVGLFEGAVRSHNLLYALAQALAVPTVPTASRYAAQHDERRLHQLAIRGTRYTLTLFVPICVTLMTLAEPVITVWLGEKYEAGATALTIIVAYWLLFGALVATPGFLVGLGQARKVAQVMIGIAVTNLVLSLVLTPELGVEGPAVAVTTAFVLGFPFMLRIGLQATSVRLGELARGAFGPAYALGAVLAAALLVARQVLELDTLPVVFGVGALGVMAYWTACYLLWFDENERALVRGLVPRRGTGEA